MKCSRMFLLGASSRHMASHLDISSHRTVSMLSAAQVKTTATPGTSSEPPPSPDSRSSCDGWRPKPRHDRRPRVPAHSLRFPSRQPDQTGQDGAKKRRQAVAALTHLPKRASRKTAWTCPQRKTSSVALKTPSVAVKMSSAAVDTKTRRG